MPTEDKDGDGKDTDRLAANKRRFLRRTGQLVDGRVTRLQNDFLAGQPRARAQLAELRRSVGQLPGDNPEIWAITEVPTGDLTDATPTARDWAVHLASCLYGLHQQGRGTPAHQRGRSFGQAVRALAGDEGEKSPVWRRFTAAMLAQDITATRDHLQGIVGQMHSTKLFTSFDYAALADDLFALQDPQSRPGVHLRWQRDFYSLPSDSSSPSDTPDPEN